LLREHKCIRLLTYLFTYLLTYLLIWELTNIVSSAFSVEALLVFAQKEGGNY